MKHYKLGKHPKNKENLFTEKHCRILQEKVSKDIGFSVVFGTVQISKTKRVPALGDVQYFISCQPKYRDKVASVLDKSGIAYLSVVGYDDVPGRTE